MFKHCTGNCFSVQDWNIYNYYATETFLNTKLNILIELQVIIIWVLQEQYNIFT